MEDVPKIIYDENGPHLNPVRVDIHFMEMKDNSATGKAKRFVEYYDSWDLDDVDLDTEIRKFKRIEDYYDSFDIL